MLLLARTTPRRRGDASARTGCRCSSSTCARRCGSGSSIRPIDTMINHNTTEVFFDELGVPAENLIGEEGKGFRYILDGMNAERILIAAECIGDGRWFIATRSRLRQASAWCSAGRSARTRACSSRSRAPTPSSQAADLMARKAAALFDAGEPAARRRTWPSCWPPKPPGRRPKPRMQTHRRLRLRARVRHRAQVPRDAALPDRADLDQPGAGVPGAARARDAAVVLIRDSNDCFHILDIVKLHVATRYEVSKQSSEGPMREGSTKGIDPKSLNFRHNDPLQPPPFSTLFPEGSKVLSALDPATSPKT